MGKTALMIERTGRDEFTRLPRIFRIFLRLFTAGGRARAKEHLTWQRVRLGNWVFRACAGPYGGLLPPGTTCSIPEIMGDATSCANVVRMSCVCPASVENYSIPEDLSPAFRRQWAFLPRNVYTMRDVIVGIPTGLCVSDDRVFLESYGNAFRWYARSLSGARPKELSLHLSAKPLDAGSGLTCFGSATYGHVLLQEVPRLLYALEEKPDLAVLTLEDPPRHVSDLLALLQEKKVIRGEVISLPRGLYRVADYTFTADEEDSGFVRRESVQLIRRYLGQDGDIPSGPVTRGPKDVYLSRRRSERSFTNEADVEAMLSHRGFAVVYLEDLDLAEEIALFQQAETIVGPHGAGLANLVWIRPGTRVVEMMSPRMICDFFLRLARLMDAEHELFWARPDEGWGSVDLDSLASLVDRMRDRQSV